MKRKIKLLALVLTVICVLGAGTAIAFAEESNADDVSLRIENFSLSLENVVFMNFKVSSKNVENAGDIKILAWNAAPVEYKKGTEALCLDSRGTEGGTGYEVFQYTDLAAKDMTKMVYVCAYVNVDGEEIYSSPAKFSIAMYAYLKRNAATPDAELVKLMDSMLAYGAASQIYFDYKTDFLATATMYQIDVVNGKLEDGFSKGWYQQNGAFTLTANAPASGYRFSHWENSAGENVGTTETLTLTANATEKYTAVYEAAVTYSQGLTYSENSDGTLTVTGIGTCTDTDLRIPPEHEGKKVTAIGAESFRENSNIMGVTISDSVIEIGYEAFFGCNSLENIIIGNNVRTIESGTFRACNNLENVKIGSSVESIGWYAFYDCVDLTSIVIPDSVKSICEFAFSGCKNLSNVTIGNNVKSIGYGSFADCSSLTSLVIPESVTNIGAQAFQNCKILTSVTFCNPNGWSLNGEIINSDDLSDPSVASTYFAYCPWDWVRE